jgi:hypothetical protein
MKIRKNKKELFRELTDSLENYLAEKIHKQTGYKTVIIPGIIGADSLVFSLIRENNAIAAILIRSLEVYFDETSETNTTNSDGKPQVTTAYDLCARNEYAIFSREIILNGSKIGNRRFFTSRSVNDGHFSFTFGPDIVGKKKHTYEIVERNAQIYMAEIVYQLQQLIKQ